MFNNRVIMGGLPRSGSTLLRTVLNGHPNIIAPSETSLYSVPYNKIFDINYKRRQAVIEGLADRLGISLSDVEKCLNNYRNRIDLYDKLMTVCLKTHNRLNVDTWIQKTPSNCHYYKYIYNRHKNMLFISIIRDGRDVITSFFPERGYYCSIDRYIEVMRDVYSFASDRHLIVKYEEFISDKVCTLKNILSFIGLRWSDIMLENYLTMPGSELQSEKVKSSITNKWVNRWKNACHKERIKSFYNNSEAIMWLEKSGYVV